jgi:hypothetical protein
MNANAAENAAEEHAEAFTETPVFEGLARAGYAARGVIYVLIGILAYRVATGVSEHKPNQQGAMQQIADQPFGHALLLLTAIGLGGYSLWRLAQALVGHTPEYGEHSKLDRIGALGSCLAYAAFTFLAISVLQGSGGNSSAQPKKATSDVLGIGIFQAYLGLSKKFLTYSKTGQMSPGVLKAFTAIGVVGLVARAVAFVLIGLFALKAARDYSPKDAVGIDGALARLTQHAYGTTALIVVAVGLIIFGVYSIADARYRKI